MNNYEEIIAWVEDSFNQALNGEISPLKLYFELSELEKIAKAYKESLRECAINELHGAKEYVSNGIKFEKFQGATYDYKNNSEWQKQNEILTDIESKCKTVIQLKNDGKEIDIDLIPFDGAVKNNNKESIKIIKLKN